MKLIRETLFNFKGVKEFTLETGGGNAEIYGANAVGKSTLFDAFLWVLFDKDSAGKKDFQLKTLDAAGKEIPMIDHSVELVLECNGSTVTLKKTLKEVWTKKKGSPTASFTGHETAYEVDGVPKAKKEFDFYIGSLGDEALLRMLTDPDFFAGKMAWKDRRNILMGMHPDLTDEAVIASDKSLKDLTALLAGKSIEDFRKVIAARKAKVNADLQMIPIRVDEATRALPDASGLNAETVKAEIAGYRENLSAIETKLTQLSQGGAIADKNIRARQIEADILAAKNKAAEQKQCQVLKQNVEMNALNVQKDALVRSRSNAAAAIVTAEAKIVQLDAALNDKRNEWKAITAEQQAEAVIDCNCPTCGQRLPADQTAAAHAKALSDFNHSKSVRLTANVAAGKELNAKKITVAAELAAEKDKLPKLDAEIDQLAIEIKQAQDAIDAQKNEIAPETAEVQALKAKLAAVWAEVEDTDTAPEQERLKAAKSQWQTEIATAEQTLAKITQADDGQKRIAELKAQEKTLTAEYEQLQRSEFLSEEFIRAKVGLLEATINGKFKYARFKLFETQINGGLNEVCEVLGPDMVPYSSGLNNAAKINTGIDIINTLAEHAGFTAPIFVDNSEAVVNIIESHSQIIKLIVSGKDTKLRVEAA